MPQEPDMTNPENIAEQKKFLNTSRFRMGTDRPVCPPEQPLSARLQLFFP